jgi:NADPH:quinone reductase-like Zn-dependent oxidoreductase
MKTHGNLLPLYHPNLIRGMLSVKYQEFSLPPLQENEVLIRTAYASINPSDIAFMQGAYGITKPLPVVPGFEASGTIIRCGLNMTHLHGKKVAAFVQENHQGTWAEHFIANENDIILLQEQLPIKKAAALAINPLTAYALMQTAKELSVKAMIQNAAGGLVGKWIRFFTRKMNIPLINIVRKEETKVKLLATEKYVLNSQDKDFPDQLKSLSNQLNVNVVLDAVAGEETAFLMDALPPANKANIIVYGGLAGKNIQNIDPIKIIFQEKNILGFNLPHWKKNKSFAEITNIFEEIQHDIIHHPQLISIRKIENGRDLKSALKDYIKNMSEGKILLRFAE